MKDLEVAFRIVHVVYEHQERGEYITYSELYNEFQGISPSKILDLLVTLEDWGLVKTKYGEKDGKICRLIYIPDELKPFARDIPNLLKIATKRSYLDPPEKDLEPQYPYAPEDRLYRCSKCGVVVSGFYILVVGNECPRCGSELEELEGSRAIIGRYYEPKL